MFDKGSNGNGGDDGDGQREAEAQPVRERPAGEGLTAQARAQLISVEETGRLIDFNPVLRMHLRVQPEEGEAFETTAELLVPNISIPRAGDTVAIRYNQDDPSQVELL